MSNELDQYFEFKCLKGFKARGLPQTDEYLERLNYEIKTIQELGFATYFLVTQDFVSYAKGLDIVVGSGRGSVGGSLVAYCLYITEVDPIEYGLYFERFLNPSRVSPPDIDLDFEPERREEVVEYIKRKYGADNICLIGTYGTMKARAAIQKATTVLGLPKVMGEELRALLLEDIAGKAQTFEMCYKEVPELSALRGEQSSKGQILYWAEQLEGRIVQSGVHAAGLIICDDPVHEHAPLYRTKDKRIATQWDKKKVEQVGLMKFDLLGVKNLTKLRICAELIQQYHGIKVDINNLPKNDSKTFELVCTGHLLGIFQLESSQGMRNTTIRIQPKSIEDLSTILALYRPGPLQAGLVDAYISRRNEEEEVSYPHEKTEAALGDTYGVFVFQEQVMRLAVDLCGFSASEADTLRKAIGRKDDELMASLQVKFIEGAAASGLSTQEAVGLFAQIQGFADYCFNKSHSVGYAMIAYQTAYLKTHYTAEYITACMICDYSDTDQMIKYLNEAKRLGLEVFLPDVNQSEESFTIIPDANAIQFGLLPIRGIGLGPSKEILEKRFNQGQFKGIKDFCSRVHLGKVRRNHIEALVKAGAFDSFGHTRSSQLQWIEDYWVWRKLNDAFTKKQQTYQKRQKAYKARLEEIETGSGYKVNDKGKKVKINPLKKPVPPDKVPMPAVSDLPPLSKMELLSLEHEHLGFFSSGHPLDLVGSAYRTSVDSIDILKELPDKSQVVILVVLTHIKYHTVSASKKQMAFLTAEDQTGSIEVVVFPQAFAHCKDGLKPLTPMLISGKLEVSETEESNMVKMICRTVEEVVMKEEKVLPVKKAFKIDALTIKDQMPSIFSTLKRKNCVTIDFNSGLSMDITSK